MTPQFIRLRGDERRSYEAAVVALEAEASYPLGEDTFSIDHGVDYFAFFDRLGEEERWVVLDQGTGDAQQAIATVSGVLRTLEDGLAWYVCDLKVRPAHRGQHLPIGLGLRSIPGGLLRCRRGYGISMNPSDEENPMRRRVGHLALIKAGVLGALQLWSLDAAAAKVHTPLIEAHRGPLAWLSLTGVKDILLQSTGKAMPLLHAQFGPYADKASGEIQEGAVHMLCAPTGSQFAKDLMEAGLAPSASATVFHVGMPTSLLGAILSSEI